MNTDILVVGSGPAGIQSAIHASRKKVNVIVAGKLANSSLVRSHISNYFGIEAMKEGIELLQNGKKLAEKFNAKFIEEDIINLGKEGEKFIAETETDKKIFCRALILAMGIRRTKLGVHGEDTFYGRGVSYCADCDCHFFKNKDVAVIGDGSAAISAVRVLQKYVSKVYYLTPQPQSQIEDKLKEGVGGRGLAKIELYENTKVAKICGTDVVEKIVLDNGQQIKVAGVFIELGAKGVLELAPRIGVDVYNNQFVWVNRNCETTVKGVFACGDITGEPFQLAKAVGEGCVAGLNAVSFFLSTIRKE